MKLFNHLTKTSDDICNTNSTQMYVCGPTVHAVSHIGHARTFCTFDSLRKYLTSKGKILNYGMNITDIDDKINAKVRTLHYNNLLKTSLLVKDLKILEEKMLEKVQIGIL